jgi:hypothetical protein
VGEPRAAIKTRELATARRYAKRSAVYSPNRNKFGIVPFVLIP